MKKKWRVPLAAVKPNEADEAMKKMSSLKDSLFEGQEFIKQKFVNPDKLPERFVTVYSEVNNFVAESVRDISVHSVGMSPAEKLFKSIQKNLNKKVKKLKNKNPMYGGDDITESSYAPSQFSS